MPPAQPYRRRSDLAGAIADLGVMVPLAAALILQNGLDATAVFFCAGALLIGSGLYFGVPFPVQPLKALTAVAVAQHLSPGVIHAAGLEVASFMLLFSIRGVADRVATVFTTPVVRALQLGVGLLLVGTAYGLVAHPPPVFSATPAAPWPIVLGVGALAGVAWAAHTQRYHLAVIVVIAGIAFAWFVVAPAVQPPELSLPRIGVPNRSDFAAAFFLLVIPQLPLTFGNAVVAVTDVARTSFGDAAKRVTTSAVCVSCGAGNLVSAILGGAPMCHGAGGLTAHVRLGARSRRMNIGLGSAFVVLGLAFGDQADVLLGLLPVWGLAAMLAYAGVRHALLVWDLRGVDLAFAVVAGVVGAWQGNLAITVGAGLAYGLARRMHPRGRTRSASMA
jgi:SulP family sulfate permease